MHKEPRAHLRRSGVSLVSAMALALTLGAEPAQAIVIRDDVNDQAYVVDDVDYPALVDLISPGDCIGTLVHPSFLLTVAHCAAEMSAGSTLNIAGVEHTVAEVILHPQWQDLDAFDIALLRLDAPAANVDPLPIYRGADELGEVITLVGRGVTATGLVGEQGGSTDGNLRRATNVVTAVNPHFIEVRFDAAAESGVTDLEGVGAAGDSGCPVFLDVDGVPHVAGLNSYGDESGDADIAQYGSLDYQTRVSRYVEWLEEHVDFPAPEPDAEADPPVDPEPPVDDVVDVDDDGGDVEPDPPAEGDKAPEPGVDPGPDPSVDDDVIPTLSAPRSCSGSGRAGDGSPSSGLLGILVAAGLVRRRARAR